MASRSPGAGLRETKRPGLPGAWIGYHGAPRAARSCLDLIGSRWSVPFHSGGRSRKGLLVLGAVLVLPLAGGYQLQVVVHLAARGHLAALGGKPPGLEVPRQ